MWVIYVVVAGFFVAILGIGYFGVKEIEAAASEPSGAGDREARADACEACAGELPLRPVTSDQVVFEVEHRIDAELRDIVHALHAHPERIGRVFHA